MSQIIFPNCRTHSPAKISPRSKLPVASGMTFSASMVSLNASIHQGANFESHLIKELMEMAGIQKSHTTPYHPMGNGVVGRYNRTPVLLDGTRAEDTTAGQSDCSSVVAVSDPPSEIGVTMVHALCVRFWIPRILQYKLHSCLPLKLPSDYTDRCKHTGPGSLCTVASPLHQGR